MRILTLNLWGGRLFDDIVAFLEGERGATDVFCFQEVFSSPRSEVREKYVTDLYERLQAVLDAHDGFFAEFMSGVDFDGRVSFDLATGNVIFSREEVFSHAVQEVHPGGTPPEKDWPRNVHAVELQELVVANVHGLVHHGPIKGDCQERFEQSRRIQEFLGQYEKPVVLCGDFNMRPETECLAMLEEGMVNQVERAGITDTRTSYFDYEIRMSDYILTDERLDVGSVELLPDEVSDHAALALQI